MTVSSSFELSEEWERLRGSKIGKCMGVLSEEDALDIEEHLKALDGVKSRSEVGWCRLN